MSDTERLPVCNPQFWQQRLRVAQATGRELHTAIYDIDPITWEKIQQDTETILISPELNNVQTVLDVGCGYGAIRDLPFFSCPSIAYCGVDVSPDLISIARIRHPDTNFSVVDVHDGTVFGDNAFDLAICRSIRSMLVENIGRAYWYEIAREVHRVAQKVLYIEYPTHGGVCTHSIEKDVRHVYPTTT